MDVTRRQDDFNLVVMNFSGRFNNLENRVIGQHVATQVLVEKNAAVFFGQQSSFLPKVPKYYKSVGLKKAFIAYDTHKFTCLDDKLFQLKIKERQQSKKMPLHYLSDNNYAAIQLRSKFLPRVSFIALSWVTNESLGQTRSLSTFKKLMGFIKNLEEIENIPIIVGGSFRLTPDVAVDWMPPGFTCYSYVPETPRRAVRAASFFVCSDSLMMEGIRPLSCGNIEAPKAAHRWVNPEDALYCDPVLATVIPPRSREATRNIPKLERMMRTPTLVEPPVAPKIGLTEEEITSIVETPRLTVKHNGVSNGYTKEEPSEPKPAYREIILPSRLPRAQNHFNVPVGLYRAEIHSVPKHAEGTGISHRITRRDEPKASNGLQHQRAASADRIHDPDEERYQSLCSKRFNSLSQNDISQASGSKDDGPSRTFSWSGNLYDEEQIDTNTWCYMS